MKVVRCIQTSLTSHSAVQVGHYYELLGTERLGSYYWLVLRLQDGSEILQDASDFLILDHEWAPPCQAA